MPAPSWEDLTEFFETDDDGGFAIVATIYLADGSARDINVIYDEPFTRTNIDGGGNINGADYHFTAAETDLTDLGDGDKVLIDGRTLRILSIESDGTGVSHVWLTPYQESPHGKGVQRL